MGDSLSHDSPRSRQPSTTTFNDNVDTKARRRSTASIRVSRACTYCRSKHIRCDGTMPVCKRCLTDNRPCYYLKSRRGIRDPKERSLIPDKPPPQHVVSEPLYIPNTSREIGSSILIEDTPGHGPGYGILLPSHSHENPFLAAYYAYFHPAHPMALPKHCFERYLELDPESMQFLGKVIKFVGSLHVSGARDPNLREAIIQAACGPLPMTPHSVTGLLILSIAAVGETEFGYQNGWTGRAISIAHEIGMQHKAFANTATDPILAESYRRTYWGLYLLDSLQAGRESGTRRRLPEDGIDVDLPCEEWEYDAGQIPPPTSLMEYDRQNHLEFVEFSSWAYLIDICRIARKLNNPHQDTLDENKVEYLDRIDALIHNWLVKVPQWKKDLVDADGISDMVLFHAIAFAQQSRLRIFQRTSRQGLDLRAIFSLGPSESSNGPKQNIKNASWKSVPLDIRAANSVCSLFQQSFPIENLSPLALPGLLPVAIAYLDARVFLDLDTPDHRKKLDMLLRIMTIHGGVWPISRKIADEVRDVAKDYSILPESLEELPQEETSPLSTLTGTESGNSPSMVRFDDTKQKVNKVMDPRAV